MASEADTESHMEWTEVAKRLAPARNYWLGTTTVGGAEMVGKTLRGRSLT